MKVGILGSGFGLYSYMPAIRSLGVDILMPERYRSKLRMREDVKGYESEIAWVESEDDVLARCEALVLAKRPGDQVAYVKSALDHPQIERFLLEKPLAPTPAEADAMLASLAAAGKVTRVGFNFRLTPWAEELRQWLATARTDASLSIVWRFGAHHYRHHVDTWKRRPSQGGGVVRFYAIHLIALLAELGYTEASESRLVGEGEDDVRTWHAVVTGSGLPDCRVTVDSDASATEFVVRGSGNAGNDLDRRLADPFEDGMPSGALDRRVGVTRTLCEEFLGGTDPLPAWYRLSIELWQAIEDMDRLPVRSPHRQSI